MKVQRLKVGPEDDGQRLDRWLKKNVPGLPYILALKFLRKGQIRVDGHRAKNDMRLKTGQEIRLPPFKPGQTSMASFSSKEGDEAYIKSLVIYDDGDIIAINKPFGLATQGGNKIDRHVDGLLEYLKNEEGLKPRLLHRLDRDTSGLLLLARKPETVRQMGKIFMGRNIRKYYWALTAPPPGHDEEEIKVPLSKGTGSQKDKMIPDKKEGKFALTLYKVIERAGKKAAFVIFWPRTGRTHQIRAHAAYIGCPILGDGKYGSKMIEGVAKRLHLHAAKVVFIHPVSGKSLVIEAPLSVDLLQSWGVLGFSTRMKQDPFADIPLSSSQ